MSWTKAIGESNLIGHPPSESIGVLQFATIAAYCWVSLHAAANQECLTSRDT